MEYISRVYLHKDTEYRLLGAAEKGDVGILVKLLRKKADPNVRDDIGRSALSLAAAAGQTEVVRLLLEAGANVNAKEFSFVSPLHQATRGNHIDVVKLLILGGAELRSAVTKSGLSPLDLAEPNSPVWEVIKAAQDGELPEIDDDTEESAIPEHALGPLKTKKKSAGKKGKKGKKKGGKGKKKGKSKGKKKKKK